MKSRLLLVAIVNVLVSCGESDSEEITPWISEDMYHHNGEVQTLFENDPDGVNIIILGDGFIKDDLLINGTYEKRASEIIRHLFTVPPFSTYQKFFNACIVHTESRERDINGASTIFNSYFLSSSDRLLRLGNTNSLNYYVEKAVASPKDAHIIIVLVNTYRYGGSAPNNIAITTNGPHAETTAVHEVGHAFANLADEYVDDVLADTSLFNLVPYYANVDAHDNLDTIKWAHFIGKKGYEAVGAYEGGLYVEKGIWRPEEVSIMRNSSTGYFNAPSREAIVKRIYEIKKLPYDFQSFLENDIIPDRTNFRISVDKVLFNCR